MVTIVTIGYNWESDLGQSTEAFNSTSSGVEVDEVLKELEAKQAEYRYSRALLRVVLPQLAQLLRYTAPPTATSTTKLLTTLLQLLLQLIHLLQLLQLLRLQLLQPVQYTTAMPALHEH